MRIVSVGPPRTGEDGATYVLVSEEAPWDGELEDGGVWGNGSTHFGDELEEGK